MTVSLLKYHHSGRDNLNEKRHFHDREFEILHILSGDGTMMIKDKLYSLSPNTVFFISGSDAHCSMPENPSVYIRNKINFSKDLLTSLSEQLNCNDIVDELFSGGNAVKLPLETSLKVDECFLKLHESESLGEIPPLVLFLNIFAIIETVAENNKKSVPCIKNKISDVIEYINKNINQKLSLDAISKSTKISKYYLCHSFCEAVGMTVFEYVEFVRIAKAKQMLSETSESISAISVAVGYDSFAYFSKVFKKRENMTPNQYRKTHRFN